MVVEVRFFHRAGGYRWVEVSAHALRDEAGQFAGAMGTLRDVTDRHAVNEERQRLATNIRQLLDASGEGIYGWTRAASSRSSTGVARRCSVSSRRRSSAGSCTSSRITHIATGRRIQRRSAQ